MNVEEVRETLGDYLIRERESRNVTAEEMAKATHLSIHFIEALEHNDFSRFSQKESIPGFLKLYARHLPLNYEVVLKRYQIEDERIQKQRLLKEMSFSRDYASPIATAGKNRHFTGHHFGKWILPGACVFFAVAISLSIYLAPERTQPPVVPRSAKSSLTAQDFQSPQSASIRPDLTAPAPPSASALPPEETPSPALPESFKPAAPLAAPVTVAEKEKVVVIGNRDSKRYHLPGMKYYNEVKAYHRVVFNSEEEALKAGYVRARE